MANALLTRQQVFAAKLEATAGTAESLTAAEAAFNIFEAQLNAEIPPNIREGQSALSKLPQIPGARAGVSTFSTEVVGKGSSGVPSWADFLEACGMSLSTATYSPQTGGASAKTTTIGLYRDGILKQIAGAMGNVTFNFTTGNPARANWDFRGAWKTVPTDTALLTPTYPTVKPPRFAGATFTIGGTAYKVSEVEIALNNEIVLRQLPSEASGYLCACIVNRDIAVTVNPEAELLATKDWYADHLASTEVALSLVLNGGTNNTITFAAPKMSLRDAPQDVDRDGIWAHSLVFGCNRNAAAGDDELTIAFT